MLFVLSRQHTHETLNVYIDRKRKKKKKKEEKKERKKKTTFSLNVCTVFVCQQLRGIAETVLVMMSKGVPTYHRKTIRCRE